MIIALWPRRVQEALGYYFLSVNFLSQLYLAFFAIVFVANWLTKAPAVRRGVLLLASFMFYGWLHPWMPVVLAAYILANFWISTKFANSSRAHSFYWFGIALNLAGLCIFKYFDFLQSALLNLTQGFGLELQPSALGVLFPLGLSFYALQLCSYLTDVYRGVLPREASLVSFALYVSFFPKLIAGPIERGTQLLPQIAKPATWSWTRFNQGWQLAILGYLNKVFIADNLALLVDKVFTLQKPTLWLLATGALAFTIQIYADFLAYTQLARGFGKLLGFDLSENFNSPYISLTPSDFWQRWHMSFSNWLRDYIFSPLRRWTSKLGLPEGLKVLLPSLAAMLFSGFWHGVGWNFIVWGLYFGLLIAAYQLLSIDTKLATASWPVKLLAWGVNFFWVVAGWAIFRSSSLAWLLNALHNPIYGRASDSLIAGSVILTLTAFYGLPLLLRRWLNRLDVRFAWAEPVFSAAALILIVIFLDPVKQEFIYFNF